MGMREGRPRRRIDAGRHESNPMNPNHGADLPVASHWLLRGYASGGRDEMLAASGDVPREHFREVIEYFERLRPEGLREQWQEAQRLLRESGVTYSIHDDPQGRHRPWSLDPVPMLLTQYEWKRLETGLQQRAELLNHVLQDLYGPQTLLRERALPAELVFAHPGFLLPVHPMSSSGPKHLMLYAADLGRDASGELIVLADRAQAPSGMGYALENRLVMSRVLPSLYREAHVQRMAFFFRALRDSLAALAPQAKGEPRVVLHTPGPDNETYFEHAYLASYLGYTLVEGSDLTVRDSRVWLKTLEGLQPIDVILRRVDDVFCDPLELRNDSLLGTPGLVQSCRRGRVALANPLGSGILENPALSVFLPELCRRVFGEELKLPAVRTWWCGRHDDRRYVLDNLERLLIRPIHPLPTRAVLLGSRMTPDERAHLAHRIQAKPHLYVAQEPQELSTVPVLVQDRLEPRRMTLRAFLVAYGNGYLMLPGALTRVAGTSDQKIISNQTGGLSKDTWVIQTEPEPSLVLPLPARRPPTLTRGGDELSSRVAENLFWLGRYTERAESVARLLREVLWRLVDQESDYCPEPELHYLLQMTTHFATSYPGFVGADAAEKLAHPHKEMLALFSDASRIGTMRFNVQSVLRAGRSVRDRLSDDTWRLINALEHSLSTPANLPDALEGIERLILTLAGFAGLSTESMSRGPSWQFIEIGRRLERAMNTLHLLRLSFPPRDVAHSQALRIVLGVCDSWKVYRLRYGSSIQVEGVLDLTLVDEIHPRSVGYQFVRLNELVAMLPSKVAPPRRSAEERCLLEAQTKLRLADVFALVPPEGKGGIPQELDRLLGNLRSLLISLSDALNQAHFNHTLDLPQQLVDYR